METTYLVLANAVFALHLVFVLAVLPSTVALCLGVYRTKEVLLTVHSVCIYGMALGQALLLACPLVQLEHSLREAGGTSPWYNGSFVVFVVERVTGFQLPVALVTSLSMLVLALTTIALFAPRLGAMFAPMTARAGPSRPATRP